jgi:hypothetical protein
VGLVTDEEHRPLSEETPLSPGFEMRYDTLRGEQGIKGETGARGATGATGPALTRRKAWAVVYLFGLAFLLSVTSLFWINHEVRADETAQAAQQRQEQAAQRKAGLAIEQAICTDMGTMARIPPPTGNASANPSRAYEQDEHRAWAGLYAGLGCKRIGG